jgi:hypothetical protein
MRPEGLVSKIKGFIAPESGANDSLKYVDLCEVLVFLRRKILFFAISQILCDLITNHSHTRLHDLFQR